MCLEVIIPPRRLEDGEALMFVRWVSWAEDWESCEVVLCLVEEWWVWL